MIVQVVESDAVAAVVVERAPPSWKRDEEMRQGPSSYKRGSWPSWTKEEKRVPPSWAEDA